MGESNSKQNTKNIKNTPNPKNRPKQQKTLTEGKPKNTEINIDVNSLEREHIEVDGQELRFYTPKDEEDDLMLPSVTTILNYKDTPNKDKNIKKWENRNNGKKGNPNYKHIKFYKQKRGTLIHHKLLKKLGENPFGKEERQAIRGLHKYSTDYDVVYSVLLDKSEKKVSQMHNKYDYHHNKDKDDKYTISSIYKEDLEYCEAIFNKILKEKNLLVENPNSEKVYLTENVIEIEKFLANTHPHYAGTCDLIYEASNNDIVLADLKTTSGIRDHYRTQLSAYSNATKYDIDRREIWWMNPDTKKWKIEKCSKWNKKPQKRMSEFSELTEKFRQEYGDKI